MPPFVVTRDTSLPPAQAWDRLVDWRRHARFVPLTSIEVRTGPPNQVGTVFSARTQLGRFGFDDPMEIVEWDPPADGHGGRCRLEKRGRVMLGWAELSVEPGPGGSRVTWREDARPARLPKLAARVAAVSGRLLFGRVLRGLLDG